MLIEFLGLPGSGKSTVLKASRLRAKQNGHQAFNVDDLGRLDKQNPPGFRHYWADAKLRQSYHIAQFLASNGSFFDICAQLYKSNYRNLGLLLNAGANSSRHQLLRSHFDSLWVDEGFLHLGSHAILVATVWGAEEHKDYLEAFCEFVPLPDYVIFVSSSVETARAGIFARMPKSNDERAIRRYLNAFGGDLGMKARSLLIDEMIDILRCKGVPILELEGHSSLDVMSREVVRKLKVRSI